MQCMHFANLQWVPPSPTPSGPTRVCVCVCVCVCVMVCVCVCVCVCINHVFSLIVFKLFIISITMMGADIVIILFFNSILYWNSDGHQFIRKQ